MLHTDTRYAVPHATIVSLALKYGPQLHVPEHIDGARVLYALSGTESSYGANCKPRHEPAFDRGGLYSHAPEQAALLDKYGSAAACSYGPWQLILCNAPGFTPDQLLNDPDAACRASVAFINRHVLGRRGASTVAQIGEAYNSGRISDHPSDGVLRYARTLCDYYAKADLTRG